MKHVFLATAIFAGTVFSLAAPSHAQPQTAYPIQSEDHYLPMPQMPGASATTANAVDQSSAAQGHYLRLPPGYRQPASVQSQPAASAPVISTQYAQPKQPAAASVNAPVVTSMPVITSAPAPQAYRPVAAMPVPVNVPDNQIPVIYPQPGKPVPQPQTVTPTSYDDMSTYTYDPNMDPAKHPYKTPIARDPKTYETNMGLGTLAGYEVGAEVSGYSYREFGPDGQEFIRITGPTFGVVADATERFGGVWFVTGDFRGSYGLHNYTGGDQIISGPGAGTVIPSTKDSISDWMFDLRVLSGRDYLIQDAFWGLTDVDLSPYSGLGFRYLYEDGSGTDSNGVAGYSRYSHYFYLPLGVTPRFRLSDTSRLTLNMEYDLLLTGWQVSALGEADPGETDLTNNQNTGYGLRASIMYEQKHWSVGPFMEFWDIGQSTTDCNNAGCGDEPHNQTIEYGLKALYRF